MAMTSDRLWRKTRSRQNQRCYGVDPNRNFDIDFGVSGVTSNPCGDTYPGRNPFSEPETANIRNKINEIKSRVKAYLSFHSYSQMLLTPFGHTSTRANDHGEMMRVGRNSMNALRKVHGKVFRVGPAPDLLCNVIFIIIGFDAASGSSADWAKVKAGIKYTFTYELRPAAAGRRTSGFILNRSEIKPSAEEVMASLISIAKDIIV
ncbi:hypothetical protein KUTeg_010828 [Tegillarca granosa]|uniref:Peptidase M14 domain-containing protein n=1 Tax=Tegillarca granosa TaxID=220873 RepID=A0ABQ9F787_TEGGR|nr:hypothetical protein KUTeg_010828 [Tegillarca granosa]